MSKILKTRRDTSEAAQMVFIFFTETPIGLLNLRGSLEAACQPDLPFNTEAVVFGSDDFLASLGKFWWMRYRLPIISKSLMQYSFFHFCLFLLFEGGTRTEDAKELLFARQFFVTHCKAFNLQAIDMVHINFKGNAFSSQCLASMQILAVSWNASSCITHDK